MDFSELVHIRRSVRKYTDQPVDIEKLNMCLEAARLAPSACNSQPWSFVVVNDPALIAEVAPCTFLPGSMMNRFSVTAPVLVVQVVEPANLSSTLGGAIKKQPYQWMDNGIAAAHFCLQAADLGLGTCMLGWFDENSIKKLLNIPKSKRIGLVITLGYPDNGQTISPVKPRKPLDQIVQYNRKD